MYMVVQKWPTAVTSRSWAGRTSRSWAGGRLGEQRAGAGRGVRARGRRGARQPSVAVQHVGSLVNGREVRRRLLPPPLRRCICRMGSVAVQQPLPL
jgi:hypothetical protein